MLFRRSLLTALFGLQLSCPGWAAASTQADRVYQVDLTHYFATADEERAERARVFADVAHFGTTHPRPRDGAGIESFIREAERIRAELKRHESYLHLKTSLDTRDTDARSADEETLAQIAQLRTMLDTQLQRLTRDDIATAVAQRPSLGRYAFLIEQARRNGEHTLPAAEQLILDRLSGPSLSALFDLYVETLRSTPFAQIDTPEGKRDARTERQALAASADRSIRQQAAQALLDGYASRGAIYASILLEIVRERERIARLKRFDDAPAEAYFNRFLTPAAVKACLASVERGAEVNRRYQRLRTSHLTAMTGTHDARSWDLTAPIPGFAPPELGIDQVRKLATEALAPLGSEYTAVFRALLDPATGRADIGPVAANRYSGGFSVSVPHGPSALYVGHYGGTVRDARVIVHEGGHAVHGQLMADAGTSPLYMDGPNWLGETFAILNELLLYDHLYTQAADPQTRAYYLELLTDDMTFQIFTSAMEGTLEQSIYEGVAGGHLHDAADLDALTLATLAHYEIWSAEEPQRAHLWMTRQLMFEDPLYLVNYLYAGLLATKMYAMASADPADFQRRYLPLLRNGFHAAPAVLLREFFGRDVPEEQLIADDIAVIESKTADLRALYHVLEHPDSSRH